MAETLHIDASHLENVLDRFTYNLGCELTARAEQQPTLRDRFAMAALTGLLAGDSVGGLSANGAAYGAYEIADAMLEARKPKTEPAK